MTEMDNKQNKNDEEEKNNETCERCSCMECNGTGITEWKEYCDCGYRYDHTFGDKCVYEGWDAGYHSLVLKSPEEICRLGLFVCGDIFLHHVIPGICGSITDDEEE